MVYVFYTYMNRKTKHSYNGGGNYALRILRNFCKTGKSFSICVPKGYEPVSEPERELFDNPNIKILEVDDNFNFQYENSGEIWFPNLSPLHYDLLKKYKEKGFKVYITEHDTRNIDLKMDQYDRYFYEGIRYWLFYVIEPFYILTYRIVSWFITNKYLKYCDKVFTVSNYSLIEITRRYKVRYIQTYYQGTLQEQQSGQFKALADRKYMLFVSGGRREKNFLRTLIAYLKFAKETKTDIMLIATGIDNHKKNNILRCKKIDKTLLEKYVLFYDYVSNEDLNSLYKNCEFLLYTSKNEGFGIPMLEALHFGKRVVAAYGSAIPETIGAMAIYVNPYNEESIYKGILRMAAESKKYKKQMETFKTIVDEKVKVNDQLFMNEFHHWE